MLLSFQRKNVFGGTKDFWGTKDKLRQLIGNRRALSRKKKEKALTLQNR
jgi:hypothetical protein